MSAPVLTVVDSLAVLLPASSSPAVGTLAPSMTLPATVVRMVTLTVALSSLLPAAPSAGTVQLTGPVPLQLIPDALTKLAVDGMFSVSVVAGAGSLPLLPTLTT